MDKNLKETIKIAKSLQKKELLYMNDSIGLEVEPNYQVLALIIEELNIIMDKDMYEALKEDKARLINEMAILTFKDEDLVSETDIEFKEYIIREYVDIDDPVLIEDTYVFTIEIDRLQKLYKKALMQIKEGKFKNIIF